MTAAEAEAFEKDPLFALSIRMREWDERAKEENIPVPDLVYLKRMAADHLIRKQNKTRHGQFVTSVISRVFPTGMGSF